jgi:hypothetical protein
MEGEQRRKPLLLLLLLLLFLLLTVDLNLIRFLIQACQKLSTIKGYGVEYDKELCIKAENLVTANNLTKQIQIIHNNVLDVEFSEATVLFIYLVPEGILKLKDMLLQALDRGVRIVTYVFSIPGLTPDDTILYKKAVKIYLYKRPSSIC